MTFFSEEDKGQDMYLDAGYVGDTVSDAVKAVGVTPVVCEKGFRKRCNMTLYVVDIQYIAEI